MRSYTIMRFLLAAVTFLVFSLVDGQALADVVIAVDISGTSHVLEDDAFTNPLDSSTKAWSSWQMTSDTATWTWTDGTVTLTLDPSASWNASANRAPNASNQGTYEDLYRDFIILNRNADAKLTLSGLTPNSVYGVTVYSYEPFLATSTTWTPLTPPGTAQPISGELVNPADSLFPENASANFTTLQTDASGQYVFSLEDSPDGWPRVNGIAIYEIPQTGTVVLIR